MKYYVNVNNLGNIMSFNIIPYTGASLIKLGKTSEEIQFDLKMKPDQFKEFENNIDLYEFCHIHYNFDGYCEAVEFFSPAKIFFAGINLIEETYKNLEIFFLKLDKNIEYTDTGFTSYKYGIEIYAPYAIEHHKETIESVIIFEKGFYDLV